MTDATAENELREALMSGVNTFDLDDKTLLRMQEDVVSPYYRGMIPKCTRIDVPFLNKFLQREVGNIFAGLGQQLVVLTRRNDIDERHMLMEGVGIVRSAQTRILYLRGSKSVITRMLLNRDKTKSGK